MDKRDRAFLNEIVQFTHMNHIAAICILRRTLEKGESELEDVALWSRWRMQQGVDPNQLREEVKTNHDAARIERIVVAKMFAELMSAYEDLGGLGFAIKYRKDLGVFKRYLSSSTAEAAGFLTEILRLDIPNDPTITLDAILTLPSLMDLKGQLNSQLYTGFDHDYHFIPKTLYQVAEQYRTEALTLQRILDPNNPPDADWAEAINVLLGVGPAPSSVVQKNPVRAFNKIKHRFMLTDDLPVYMGNSATGDVVEYGAFPLEPSWVDNFMPYSVAAGGILAELAALLVHLDQAGIVV